MNFDDNSLYYDKALKIFPGGTNAPQQSFKSVGKNPIVAQTKKGARFWDLDGNVFIDYHNDFGASLIGYAHPEVLEEIAVQLQHSFSSATPSEIQLELGKLVVQSIPNIEKFRFTSSGMQACSDAIQVARIFTNRKKILVFKGSGHENLNVFSAIDSDILFCSYNDSETANDIFKHHGDTIAAVIVEPVAANMGCVLPENNFLQNLKLLCTNYHSILIFDETKTGFRIAFGGAQEVYSIQADLVVYGSVLGGGFPLGGFGGRKEIMDILAPKGDFYLANNANENLLAYAAGLKTLEILLYDIQFYQQLNQKAERLDFEIGEILNRKNIVHRINRKGSMMSVFFHINSVADFEQARQSNFALFNNFFHQLLQQGIYLPPNAFQSWFLSVALTDADIDQTLEAIRKFEY